MDTSKSQRLLNEREAARYIGMSRSFLAQARMNGRLEGRTPGPPYIRCGRAIRYDLADLEQWLLANKVSR